MNYFVKHDGSVIQQILGDNFRAITNSSGEAVVAGYRGKKYEEYPASDYLAFTTTAAKYKYIGSSSNYKWVSGSPVLMTEAEIQAKDLANEKKSKKKEADRLAQELKESAYIQENTDIYPFNPLSQTLFLAQVMTKTSDIRLKRKDKPSEKMTKAKADSIFSLLSGLHNSIEDALELDIIAIDAGDYSMSNLEAIKEAQEALKS